MSNAKIKISKREFERFVGEKITEDWDHYDILSAIEDYLVEYKDYSYDTIGDNTDFEIMPNGSYLVEVETIWFFNDTNIH